MSIFGKPQKPTDEVGKGAPSPENGKPTELMAIPMLIQLNPQTRDIWLEGPLADKALCYEMLALAAKAIVEYRPKRSSDLTKHVDPSLVPKLRGN